MSDCDLESSAKALWDYQRLGDELGPADAALVLGSHDIRVADYAVELYEAGLAPVFVFSGGAAPATRRFYAGTEAEAFAERAQSLGMPLSVIRVEPRAMHTAQNFQYGLELLEKEQRRPQSLLVIQKPYMERRAKATADVVCPDVRVICTSPPIEFEAYPNGEVSRDHFINTMVGDFQRILEYPRLGFMSEQNVPPEVLEAFDCLVKLGYTERLL